VNFSKKGRKSQVNFVHFAGKSQVNFAFLLKFFLTTKNMSARLKACRMPWELPANAGYILNLGWYMFVEVWPYGQKQN